VIDGSYDTNYQVTVKHIPAVDQYEMYNVMLQRDDIHEATIGWN
jgi:hypothetical protein